MKKRNERCILMKQKGNFIVSCMAFLALQVAKANVNSCCMYVMYQPPIPKELMSLKKENNKKG